MKNFCPPENLHPAGCFWRQLHTFNTFGLTGRTAPGNPRRPPRSLQGSPLERPRISLGAPEDINKKSPETRFPHAPLRGLPQSLPNVLEFILAQNCLFFEFLKCSCKYDCLSVLTNILPKWSRNCYLSWLATQAEGTPSAPTGRHRASLPPKGPLIKLLPPPEKYNN